MAKKTILFGILVFLSLWFTGCDKWGGKGLGEKELVKINNVTISLEEFQQLLERQSLEGKMRLINEKGERDFLNNYVITREVLYQEAKKKGLEKKKEILDKMEDFKRAILIDALLEEALRGKDEVSDSEIQQYYKENESQFTEPKEVKIRHILITSDAALKEVLTRLQKGEKFEKLAATYNTDKSREDGGSLGYIKRGQLAPAFIQLENAAFSLRNKGDLSQVVKSPYGYHILQLEDSRGTVLKPLEQVKENVRFFLQGKKRQEATLAYMNEMKSKAKIVVNEKLWAAEEKKAPKPKEEKK
jgi:peptidyl-prolyl cis-trans isomerase C